MGKVITFIMAILSSGVSGAIAAVATLTNTVFGYFTSKRRAIAELNDKIDVLKKEYAELDNQIKIAALKEENADKQNARQNEIDDLIDGLTKKINELKGIKDEKSN